MTTVKIVEGAFGRWIIVNGEDEGLAWTGSAWVHHRNGLPRDSVQIANFDTRPHAKNCATAYGFTLGPGDERLTLEMAS